jgi:four helix bundle protein
MDDQFESTDSEDAGYVIDEFFDPLWRNTSYRLAITLVEHAWDDCTALDKDPSTRPVAGQMYRALGSIGANIAEGFSRSSPRDRVRFLEYALGSARESRNWYRASRPVLPRSRVEQQCELIGRICQLLLVTIRRDRAKIQNGPSTYPRF